MHAHVRQEKKVRMFIGPLFIWSTQSWKQPKCTSAVDWTHRLCHIHKQNVTWQEKSIYQRTTQQKNLTKKFELRKLDTSQWVQSCSNYVNSKQATLIWRFTALASDLGSSYGLNLVFSYSPGESDGDQNAPGFQKAKHTRGISTLTLKDPPVHSGLLTFKQLWIRSCHVGQDPYARLSQDPSTCPALSISTMPKLSSLCFTLSGTRKSHPLRDFLSSEIFSFFLSLPRIYSTFIALNATFAPWKLTSVLVYKCSPNLCLSSLKFYNMDCP